MGSLGWTFSFLPAGSCLNFQLDVVLSLHSGFAPPGLVSSEWRTTEAFASTENVFSGEIQVHSWLDPEIAVIYWNIIKWVGFPRQGAPSRRSLSRRGPLNGGGSDCFPRLGTHRRFLFLVPLTALLNLTQSLSFFLAVPWPTSTDEEEAAHVC